MKKIRFIFWNYFRRPILIVLALGVLIMLMLAYMTSMPGNQAGEFVHVSPAEHKMAAVLEKHVRKLEGPRNVFYPKEYQAAEDYLAETLRGYGMKPSFQTVHSHYRDSRNVLVRVEGRNKRTIIVGAHYDSHDSNPGADDNASGTAALLEIARILSEKPPENTVILAFYANEEPPHFQTETMGSVVHADSVKDIDLMISLEMLGFYKTSAGSQHYPPVLSLFYPDVADFVAVVGLLEDRGVVEDLTAHLRKADMKTYGLSSPAFLPVVGFSDHWSYWQHKIPAVMVTDTAFFRNDNYHRVSDTADTLDYRRMARVTAAVATFL